MTKITSLKGELNLFYHSNESGEVRLGDRGLCLLKYKFISYAFETEGFNIHSLSH